MLQYIYFLLYYENSMPSKISIELCYYFKIIIQFTKCLVHYYFRIIMLRHALWPPYYFIIKLLMICSFIITKLLYLLVSKFFINSFLLLIICNFIMTELSCLLAGKSLNNFL